MHYPSQYPAAYKQSDFSPLGASLQQGTVIQANTSPQGSAAFAYPPQQVQSLQCGQQPPMQHYSSQQTATQQVYSEQPAPQQQQLGPQQYYSQQIPVQQSSMQPQQYQQSYVQQVPAAHSGYSQQMTPMQTAPGLQPNFGLPQSGTSAVLGAQYCAQGEQVFFVNEKWASLSRDDFTILDSNRQPAFKLDSSAISLKQKRILKTIKGQAVCSLKKKLLSGSRPTWFVSLGSSAKDAQRVAVIKKDTYNNLHSASLYLNGNTSQFFAQPVPDYSARGDLQNRSFYIYRGTLPVAEIMRSLSTTEKVTGANHYVLRVSHGTDCALMITFCVVIDELFDD